MKSSINENSEKISDEDTNNNVSKSDISDARSFLSKFEFSKKKEPYDKISNDIKNEEINLEKFLKSENLEDLAKEIKGGNPDNLDDKFEKYFKLLALKHKLITNAFSSGKKCFKEKCNNEVCEKCKIIEIIKEKYKPEIDKIKLPDYNYINCLASKVKTAIKEKSDRDTPFMNKLLTGSQYRYSNYVPSTGYSGFVSIFMNLFFNQNACVLTANDNVFLEFNEETINYDPKVFDIINKNECNRRFLLFDLGVPNHANSLIIDTLEKKIYHFEPNGYGMLVGDNHIIIQDWFIDDGKCVNQIINSFMTGTPLNLSNAKKNVRTDKEIKDAYKKKEKEIEEAYKKKEKEIEEAYNKKVKEIDDAYNNKKNNIDFLKNNDIDIKEIDGTVIIEPKITSKYRGANSGKIGKINFESGSKLLINFIREYDNVIRDEFDKANKINADESNKANKINVDESDKANKINADESNKAKSENLQNKEYNMKYENLEKADLLLNQDIISELSTKPYQCEKLLYSLFREKLPEYKFYPALCTVRPDTMIINYSTQNGFDPDGYCQTINYFYLFMMLYNNNLEYGPTLNMAKWINQYNYEVKSSNAGVNAEQSEIKKYDQSDIARTFVRNLVVIFFQYLYKYIATLLNTYKNVHLILKKDEDTVKEINNILNALYTKGKKFNIDILKYNKIIYKIENNDIFVIYKNNSQEKKLKLDTNNYWELSNNKITEDIIYMEFARWWLYSNIGDIDIDTNDMNKKIILFNFKNNFIKDHYQMSDEEKGGNDYTIHGTRFRKALKECEEKYLTEKKFEDIFKTEKYTILNEKYKQKYLKYKSKYLQLKDLI